MNKGKAKPRKLTPKERAFAEAYAESGNKFKSAIHAGYSEKSAAQTANRLLKKANISEEVERLLRKGADSAELSIEKVVKELSLLAFADMAEFADWSAGEVALKDSKTLDAAQRRAVIEVAQTANGVKIKLGSKNQALEQLGRYLKMFTDKIEHSGSVENPVRVYLPENNR